MIEYIKKRIERYKKTHFQFRRSRYPQESFVTDYRDYICIGITAVFLLCFFLFPNALGRLIESIRDVGTSIAYYFCELFTIPHNIEATVNLLPKYPFFDFLPTDIAIVVPFPESWEEFKVLWGIYWDVFVMPDSLYAYFLFLDDLMFYLSKFFLIIIPFIMVAVLGFNKYMETQNNDYDKDSKALIVYRSLVKKYYVPVYEWCKGFLAFVKDKSYYWKIWLFLWCFYFNFFTIFIEFIAFYLYFVIAFDFINLYRQVFKLICDLWTVIVFIPPLGWCIIGYIVFDFIRKRIGLTVLHHLEYRDRGFINERPIVSMICGTMGKKKTTTLVDMGLSSAVMFRDKAFEKILENDLKFPNFPWVNLENEIKRAMQYHQVFNLCTARVFVRKKRLRWSNNVCREKIFGYDYERYGLDFNDDLKVIDIWETLETYAQLYFIYILQSAELLANFSVRIDSLLSDIGNFPMWDSDFFSRDSRYIDSFSRHAKILDYDSVRLGIKVLSENPKKDSFEFGVVLITEVGKERGNKIELEGKKKSDQTANQKNDRFNDWLKMIRHSATVDNYPFVRVITDEQRPESWGADARDLCEIVHIVESGEEQLAMPFFALAELIYSFVMGKFSDFYYDYRFNRSDNTLPMYLIKSLISKLHHWHLRIHSRFGYSTLKVQTELGTQDGQKKDNKYYLMTKKIYSKRFSTDCFSDFFEEKVLRSAVGLDDIEEYMTEKATFDELKKQNSYFVNDLINGLSTDKEGKIESALSKKRSD